MTEARQDRIHAQGPLFGGLKVIIDSPNDYEVVNALDGRIVANIKILSNGKKVGFWKLRITKKAEESPKMWRGQKQDIVAFIETHRRLTASSEVQYDLEYQKRFVNHFFFGKPLSKTRQKKLKFAANVLTYQKTF